MKRQLILKRERKEEIFIKKHPAINKNFEKNIDRGEGSFFEKIPKNNEY